MFPYILNLYHPPESIYHEYSYSLTYYSRLITFILFLSNLILHTGSVLSYQLPTLFSLLSTHRYLSLLHTFSLTCIIYHLTPVLVGNWSKVTCNDEATVISSHLSSPFHLLIHLYLSPVLYSSVQYIPWIHTYSNMNHLIYNLTTSILVSPFIFLL